MRRGGRPTVSAAPALGHIDHLVSVCPGATPTYIARLAGIASSALCRARKSGRMEEDTIERVLAVREQHVRLLPPPLMPVDAAAAHIAWLAQETGVAYGAIAKAVGVSYQTVYNIMGRGPRVQQAVTYAVHVAVLSTTVDDVRGVNCWTHRGRYTTMLRALQANAWSLTMLGDVYGMNLSNLVTQPIDSPMEVQVARRIERLYESIGDQPGTSARSATIARRMGYMPPIYYDEEMRLIDVPEVGAEQRAQEEARTTLCILGLTLENRSVAQIVETLGVREKDVARARKTHGVAIGRTLDGGYEAVESRPGAFAAIRAAVRDVHYRSTIESLDGPDLDYVGLVTSLATTPVKDSAAA